MIFSKPPRTPEYLAHKLISNGLQEISEKELTEIFQSINYYKLRGYTYPYQNNSVPDSPFLPNVKWSYIWNDYNFDLKLRALLFYSISFIETALKTRMTLVSLTLGATWFQVINIVRNICAHHGRLYSRQLITTPLFVVPQKGCWVHAWPNPNRVYAAICIIKNFLDICNPNNAFSGELKELMKMARTEQLPSMGFPADWETEPLFE